MRHNSESVASKNFTRARMKSHKVIMHKLIMSIVHRTINQVPSDQHPGGGGTWIQNDGVCMPTIVLVSRL